MTNSSNNSNNNNLTKLKENETLKQIIKDSFGGVIYNNANKNKYNTTELLKLYNNLEEYELQGIYLFNLFNRINNINTLSYATRYNQTLNIEETYQYIEGLGHKHFNLKNLYKQIDSILYNLDDYATKEVLNVLNSIKEQIAHNIIYYSEENNL